MNQTNNSERILSGVKNIIAVGAGKGGVGKSTISVHLAVGLRRTGASVGLMDCDIYGPSIAMMTGIEGAEPVMVGEKRIAPFDACGLKVISMANFIPSDAAMIWRGPMVHSAIKQFITDVEWGELDYLIVDLPPGTGDPPLTLAQTVGVTGALIVTTPQPVALGDAMRAAQMYRKLDIHVLGVVENMSYFVCPDCKAEHDIFGRGGARYAAQGAGLPLLGEIPMNLAMRVNTDGGDAEDDFDEAKNPAIAKALTEMVENVAGQVRIRNETKPATEPIQVHESHE